MGSPWTHRRKNDAGDDDVNHGDDDKDDDEDDNDSKADDYDGGGSDDKSFQVQQQVTYWVDKAYWRIAGSVA